MTTGRPLSCADVVKLKGWERKTPSQPMSRNWEVRPGRECWESVQVAVDGVRGNRWNRPTNGSDSFHRTGCVAPKDQQSPSETQSMTAAGQANNEGFFVLGLNRPRVPLS